MPTASYLVLCILAIALGVGGVLLVKALVEEGDSYPQEENYDDQETRGEIPLYPAPPCRITRWGIHTDHLNRGFQTESGCPVCFELRLHIQ
mgnify:CR=1 FL=1